jgi:hypothetical protein
MKALLLTIGIIAVAHGTSFAQFVKFSPAGDTTRTVTLEGYADVYYGFDFNKPKDGNRPYFVSYNRHNEINLNLAYLSITYNSEGARATFTPGFGTYMNQNYAAERLTLQNIVEANVGVKIFKDKKIWIDAGILGSPYTVESAVAFDQLLYTRSFGAEYSPYYLTGVKLSWPLSRKTTLYLFVVNGWQVIDDPNSPLSFASQLEIKPSDKLTIHWNTYAGDEHTPAAPDNKGRYFTDVHGLFNPSHKIDLAVDAYFGWQNLADSTGEKTPATWGQGNLNARYHFDKSNSISARAEYYRDNHSIFVVPVTGISGFDCFSYSLGYNLLITKNVLFRFEGRYFNSTKNIFYNEKHKPVDNDMLIIAGLIAKF